MVANYLNAEDAIDGGGLECAKAAPMHVVIDGVMCSMQHAAIVLVGPGEANDGGLPSDVRLALAIPAQATGFFLALTAEGAAEMARALTELSTQIEAGKAAA